MVTTRIIPSKMPPSNRRTISLAAIGLSALTVGEKIKLSFLLECIG